MSYGGMQGEVTGEGSWRVDREGTLHVREVTIPPSEFWSPEFKAFHVAMAAEILPKDGSALTPPKVPARNAPKADWDRFQAWTDEHFFAKPLAFLHEHYPVDVLDTHIADVRVGIITPREGVARENEGRVLINLHAGGFVYNRGLGVGQLESIPVASLGRIKVVTVDYRQAPLHCFPAASEDVEAVYRELLKDYSPEAIGIYGTSAGGALSAQAVAWFQDKGLARPGAIGIFSYFPPIAPWPWGPAGDSSFWAQGVTPKAHLSAAEIAALEAEQWYMEGVDPLDPRAYPGSSNEVLRQYPPTLLLVGTREYWLSPAIAAHARLLRLEVDSSLYAMEGAIHSAHLIAVGTPEACDAHAYVARWFGQRLARRD